MKTNRKVLLGLLALVFLLSCALVPQQRVTEEPITPTLNLMSEKIRDSIVRIESDIGYGTGFFIAPDKIVTNIHGVAGSKTIHVKSEDRKMEWTVEGIAGHDVKHDLVILKITGEGTPLHLGNSDTAQKGELVYSVGYPDRKYIATAGKILKIRDGDGRIYTSVNTTFGNSGSPLLNNKGHVVGVHIASNPNEKHSYEIPSNTLKVLLASVEPIEPIGDWNKRPCIRAYVNYKHGKIKYYAKDYQEALAKFNKAIQLNPDFMHVYLYRGETKLLLGDHEGAITDLETAFKQGITLGFEDTAAKAIHSRGVVKLLRKDYKEAITDFDKSIKLTPEDAEPYNSRGTAKYKLGDYHGAIVDFDKAIKINPEDANIYNNRGNVRMFFGNFESKRGNLEKAQRLYKEAIIDFDKTIQINPEKAYYYHARGLAKEALGEKEAAKADFDKAKELDSNVGK
ncbi:MAG: tetratricopeptide repeat protein [Candidatus Poribacteria bacterium]|nr:tetratricopeptide repeat protein [Candidatus Poribacteria bacterium]